MANESIKQDIILNIKENNNNEITGEILQSVLLAMVDALGEGAQFMGEAVQTTVPATGDSNMFYLAVHAGTYPSFNVTTEHPSLLTNQGGTWHALPLTDLPIWNGAEAGSIIVGSRTNSATDEQAYAEGLDTSASAPQAHAEGNGTNATGDVSHAEGSGTAANGSAAHSEGDATTAIGDYSHAEGEGTTASGQAAHAEGESTQALKKGAHAEGQSTTANGGGAHAEGIGSEAAAKGAHAEGTDTEARAEDAHAEGYATVAAGNVSHAEGSNTAANGAVSHAEGSDTAAGGDYSHAEGEGTRTTNEAEHAEGKFNKSNTGTRHSVGIGTSNNNRKNAVEVMDNGDVYMAGVGGYDGTNAGASGVLTLQDEMAHSYGFIFDVTKENSGATFASLSALLSSPDLSTLIPTGVRTGGMTIRFVLTSDNTYVQYRLMKNTFSTAVADWQGVDITLLAGSKNLVENAAVTDMFGRVVMESLYLDDVELTGTPTTLEPTTTRNGYYNRNTKQFVTDSSFTYNEYIIVNENYYEILNKQSGGNSIASIVLYKDDTPIYFGRLADNALIKIKAKDVIKIGLNSSSSYIKHYDGIENIIHDNSVGTSKLQVDAVTNNKIKDDTITIKKIEFKDFVQGTNRANPASCTYKRFIDRRDGVAVYIDYEQTQLQRYVTDYIPVSVNGLYCGGFEVFGNEGRGAVYDASKNYIRGINSEVYTYQDGDAYVRWTVSVSSVETPTLYVIEGTEAGQYTPYVAPKQVIKKQYIPELDGDNIEDGSITTEKIASDTTIPTTLPALSLCGKDCIKATADSITAGGSLQITTFPQYLKGNGIVTFSGKLSAFDDITLGFGDGGTNSIQIKINGTNIYVYKSGSAFVSAIAHGLTISDFIDITFNNALTGASVTVATLSGLFTQKLNEFASLEMYGYPTVQLGSTTAVTDAELRATSPYFSKPIWVFGDSYTSLYDERWTKQMVKTIGIDNFLIIGLAGGGSGDLYADLQKALAFGTPKFLLWCLGMNDSYEAWSAKFELLKPLCTSMGTELILQTIPIPNLETSNNQVQINGDVKASGYRYIDACAAMCPNNTWPWYDGYTSDGVHPTVLGAKVLAARFLSDFPEFMQQT